jgi:hypothetical protein
LPARDLPSHASSFVSYYFDASSTSEVLSALPIIFATLGRFLLYLSQVPLFAALAV